MLVSLEQAEFGYCCFCFLTEAICLTLRSPPFQPFPLAHEPCPFHGWEGVICYRQQGQQRSLLVIWTGDHQENHIRAKACLNTAVITAIISCCLFGPHLLL